MDEAIALTIGQALDIIERQPSVVVHRANHVIPIIFGVAPTEPQYTTNVRVVLQNGYEISLHFGYRPTPVDMSQETLVEAAVFTPEDEWLVPDHELDHNGDKFRSFVMGVNAHELVRLADRLSTMHGAVPARACWCVNCEQALVKEVA